MYPAGEGSDTAWEAYSFDYSPDTANQPAAAIVEAISWVKDTDALALEPLGSVVDTDALNTLFGRRTDRGDFTGSASDPTPANLRVAFDYEDCAVTVAPDRITIRAR